jgi:hypothetical protein
MACAGPWAAGVGDPQRAARPDVPQRARAARRAALAPRHSRAASPLAALAGEDRDFFDDDGLLERLDAVHANITHAAMSPRMQMHALVAAVRPLAEVLETTLADEDSVHYWERAAILYGYTDRLQEAKNLVRHWWARSDPQSYMAGYQAAEPVMPLVNRDARSSSARGPLAGSARSFAWSPVRRVRSRVM